MKPKKIKVAYILTPITFGGAEKVSLNFLRHVDRDRFDIKPILLTRPWEEEPFFAREIRRLGYSCETVPVSIKPSGGIMRVPRVAYGFYSILRQEPFDLVHTHGYFADICGLPIAKMFGIRTLSTCHGFISNDNKLKVYNKLDICALRFCKTIIAVSNDIKSQLVRSGIKQDKVAVIPNAVASSMKADELLARRHEKRLSLGIAPDDFVVGYLGRLSQEKGVNYLVDAISEMRDSGNQAKLLIIGDGPERKALEKRVKALRLDGLVVFAGFQEDTENWLAALDVFVLPSLTEGTPMALLEAMAFGLPVIASAVGGVPKIITDEINGFLVPSGQFEILCDRIKILKDNPDLRNKIGMEGLNTIIKKYDVHSWCRKIENIYDQVQ